MKKHHYLSILLLCTGFLAGRAQEKRPVDHSVYASWKETGGEIVSADGKWISWEINPARGDGWLYLRNTGSGRLDSVARGYDAAFSPVSDALVFRVRPQYELMRQARKDRKKPEDQPKDSLFVCRLPSLEMIRFARVKAFRMAEEKSSWLALHMEKAVPEKDTLKVGEEMTGEQKKEIESRKKEIRKANEKLKKAKGTDLVLLDLAGGKSHRFPEITFFSISRYGDLIGMVETTGDSVPHSKVILFRTAGETLATVHDADGESKTITSDDAGKQVSFIHTADTGKTKIYSLYLLTGKETRAKMIVDTLNAAMPEGWGVSEHGRPGFSADGSRLFFGTAPRPLPEIRDTLPDDEKVSVDVWNWKDPQLQPMQKVRAGSERNRNYLAVYHPAMKKMIQLADEEMIEVRTVLKGNSNIAAGYGYNPYLQRISWEEGRTGDVYLVDLSTGQRQKVITGQRYRVGLSPAGKYLYWFDHADSNWYAMDTGKKMKICLSCGTGTGFHDELHDTPSPVNSYGSAGWTKDDRYFLVYDRYDIWKIDPLMKERPVCITAGAGKEAKTEYRYVRLDREEEFVPGTGEVYLSGFHTLDKGSGYFRASFERPGKPTPLVWGNYRYFDLAKAKNAGQLIWRRSTFSEYPDLWNGGSDFGGETRVSLANPQQKEYIWGKAELVEWISFTKQVLQGILIKPENFDPGEKYPMLVYFYERSSDRLHSYVSPRPLSSSVNFTYLASNGYLVFIPDIPYRTGYPGEDAFNAVVSGTRYLCDTYPYIDRDRLGIQGHSWGGYQTAYIVSKTDIFRAAEAGAPVSNMTSAYGGIRWESGMSRMFQYEESQSRIGGTLWEKPMHYLANSPLFSVPTINTPLLILHNDEDGAVPWYQGIELFVALRRLGKPAWMLNYNGEAHGVRKWGNRVDFSVRMMQFFDHYLKDQPAPVWMETGVPYLEKGRNSGLELVK